MKMLHVFGWTLVVAAVLMHFCFCEWKDPTEFFFYGSTSGPQILFFVYARSGFHGPTIPGLCGLVVPVLMAGSGIALLFPVRKRPKLIPVDG